MNTFSQVRPGLALGVAGMVFAFSLGNRAAVAAGGDACKAAAKAALRSCMAEAKSDYAIALGNCANLADVIGFNGPFTVPFGTFPLCLIVRESTPMEPDASEDKYYAAGVGLVLSVDRETGERLELVQVTTD